MKLQLTDISVVTEKVALMRIIVTEDISLRVGEIITIKLGRDQVREFIQKYAAEFGIQLK